MKIVKAFSPVTITLESSEDVLRFTRIIRRADNVLAAEIEKGPSNDYVRIKDKEMTWDMLQFLGRLDL